MKFNIKSLLSAAALFLMMGVGFTACSDTDAHDDLQGIYAAPTEVTVTSATYDKTKNGSLRYFDVHFNSAEGVDIHMTLVSNQYYLTATGYTLSNYGAAKNGNYIVGSTINGSVITDGTFNLSKDGDTYTITTSALFTADGKVYRVKGTADIVCEPDDPTALTQLTSATVNADGTATVVFSTGGFTAAQNPSTWQYEYTGEGFDFQITFILSNGKLTPGLYSPNTGYVCGVQTGYEAYGYRVGTSWGEVANGAKTLTYISSGDITVTKEGSVYDILINQGKEGVYAEYKGAIPALDPDMKADATLTTCTSLVSNINYVGWGMNLADLKFAADGASGSYDAATYTTTYKGTGNVIQIELYTADGSIADGTYEMGELAPGKFIGGYDGAYGASGTFVLPITDGAAGTASYITSGTLTISTFGSNRVVVLNAGDKVYSYTGAL